jgi:uncharacterized protein involved in exopolysaccharide biosynthesis
VRYNTLAREADTNRSIYDGLLQRFRELNASSGITASNIAIVDEAQVPGAPSSPNMQRNILVALLLGLALAAVSCSCATSSMTACACPRMSRTRSGCRCSA